MRDLPPGPALLALARDVLLDELAPLLPEEARLKARLVATCMAIAAREAAAGEAPADAIEALLRRFYKSPEKALSAPGGGEGEPVASHKGEEGELLRRFALDLRRGAFETSESRERAARAILWQLTIAKLREGNPGFLAANGIAGS